MTPTVSIITCSLNPELLSRTFDSILTQNFSDWEWTIVSPYSIDKVSKAVKTNDSAKKVQVVLDRKEGIYAAMNIGVNSSNGELLVFLNEGDEFYNSQSLNHLVDMLDGKPWGYGLLQKIDAIANQKTFYKFLPYNQLLHRFGWKYVPHPSSIVSRIAFTSAGGFNVDEATSADQEFFLRISRISRPATTNKTISKFYLGGSSSRSVTEAMNDSKRISNSIFGPILGSRVIDNIFWKLNGALKSIIKRVIFYNFRKDDF